MDGDTSVTPAAGSPEPWKVLGRCCTACGAWTHQCMHACMHVLSASMYALSACMHNRVQTGTVQTGRQICACMCECVCACMWACMGTFAEAAYQCAWAISLCTAPESPRSCACFTRVAGVECAICYCKPGFPCTHLRNLLQAISSTSALMGPVASHLCPARFAGTYCMTPLPCILCRDTPAGKALFKLYNGTQGASKAGQEFHQRNKVGFSISHSDGKMQSRGRMGGRGGMAEVSGWHAVRC
eukprot:354173-Chlamydomonas_euryale.AAC.5